MRGMWRRRTPAALAALLALALVVAGCTDDSSDPNGEPTRTSSPQPAVLTFGVYGPPHLLSAYRTTVSDWNAASDGPEVKLRAWRSQERMRAAIESGVPVPDVFLAPRSDLRLAARRGLHPARRRAARRARRRLR